MTPEVQTFLVGIGVYTLSQFVKDYIRDKLAGRKEDTKIGELSAQTNLLRQIADGQNRSYEQQRKQNKRFKKTLARIDENVIHVKEIVTTAQPRKK